MQKNLQTLSMLRQQFIHNSGPFLDLSGKLTFNLNPALFDAVIGELPMASWMQAFLVLHGTLLMPDIRVMLEGLHASWLAYETDLSQKVSEVIESSTSAGVNQRPPAPSRCCLSLIAPACLSGCQ